MDSCFEAGVIFIGRFFHSYPSDRQQTIKVLKSYRSSSRVNGNNLHMVYDTKLVLIFCALNASNFAVHGFRH